MLAQQASVRRRHAHRRIGWVVNTFKNRRGCQRAASHAQPVALVAALRSLCSATTRLQLLPTYVPALLLAIGVATGGFGDSAGVLAAMAVLTLGLVSFSLLL